MPKSPEDENVAEPKLQFAVVECALFSFHQMIREVRLLVSLSHCSYYKLREVIDNKCPDPYMIG